MAIIRQRAPLLAGRGSVVNYRRPVWTGAPATLTNQAPGAQIPFASYASDPDGDALTFSLASGETNGYSITGAGVLTIGSVSQSLTIRVSDGALSADHDCAVTVTAADAWPAATRVVRTSGGTVDGLPTYTTINAAVAAATAGDVIEIVAASGTSQTITENVLISGKSGTADQPITLRVRQGYSIIVRPTSGTVLTVTNSHYITITGSDSNYGSLSFGRVSDYNIAQYATCYPHTYTAHIGGNDSGTAGTSSHILLKDCTFSGARHWGAIWVWSAASKVCFDHCRFAYHGTHYNPALGDPATMDGFSTYAARTLIRRCEFDRYGGHDQVTSYRNWLVLHSSSANGYWRDIYPSAPANIDGYRPMQLQCSAHTFWNRPFSDYPGSTLNTSDPDLLKFGPMMVSDNTFHMAGSYRQSMAIKFLGWGCTLRGNLFYDGISSINGVAALTEFDCSQSQGDGPGTNPRFGNNCQFHNTVYNFNAVNYGDSVSFYTTTGNSSDEYAKDRIRNNLWQSIGDLLNGSSEYWFKRDTNNVPPGSYANRWKDTIVSGNVISYIGTASKTMVIPGHWSGGFPAAAQSAWPSNVLNNSEATVTFANVGSLHSRSRAGFLPTAGTGYNDAPELATITSGGGASTSSITLSDAGWIYDPESATSYDLAYFGESNDWIAYGSSLATAQLVQVSTVNRDTGAVTLKTPINAANGTKIWHGGNDGIGGRMVWRHRGAVQQ